MGIFTLTFSEGLYSKNLLYFASLDICGEFLKFVENMRLIRRLIGAKITLKPWFWGNKCL